MSEIPFGTNLKKINSGVLSPPGLKPPKLQYLTSSHVLELVKEGRFYDIPADIVLCHFDNLYKYYVWHLKQEELRKQAEKSYADQILANWSSQKDNNSFFMTDDVIDELLQNIETPEFKN
jgi:hypothetical protein